MENVCENISKRRLTNCQKYKKMIKSWAEVSQERAGSLQDGENDVNGCSKVEKTVAVRSFSPLEKQRVDCGPEKQFSKDNVVPCHKLTNDSHSKDTEEFNALRRLEWEEPQNNDIQSTSCQLDKELDKENISCSVCALGGDLLYCDGKECNKRFHLSCVDPPFSFAPPGVWHCAWCVQKKIQFGIYSVSTGIESVLDAREDRERNQKQYMVKYRGLAHVHNCWIPERELKEKAKSLLALYKSQVQGSGWKTEWALPQRLLQKRQLRLDTERDLDCKNEWLVKWSGLGYDRATWELETASFLKSKLVKDFENRHKVNKTPSNGLIEIAYKGQHESTINKLRKCWSKRQNSVVFDNEARFAKVVLFMLSSKDNNLPFLVVTPSSSLSAWEAEFSKHKSSNIVVYKGNDDVRSSIRSLEFYNKYGCLMFQVLLTNPGVCVEDLRMLEVINWGGVIVDECQRPIIHQNLNQISALATEMRLLIATDHIMESRSLYKKLISFISPGVDQEKEKDSDSDDFELDGNVSKLKEKLACFIVYQCKDQAPRFSEYWVPVKLSNVQLEQYCANLLSKSKFLCSSLRCGLSNSLHELLVSERECCNHPYLVDMDHSLRRSLTEDLSMAECLNTEIEMSGKLQVLEKCLLHIKEQGLRVLIIFQPHVGPGTISAGSVLEDYILQRFGKDSYVYISGKNVLPSKKQAAVKLFNNKESSQYMFLLEQRACHPSINLSSTDTVILFDSSWDPLKDLKALQRNSSLSQFQQLKVFRLYSVHTVEEKLLILAKQGLAPDLLENVSQRTCHSLLTWGVLYLFDKLDQFHNNKNTDKSPCLASENCFLDDVVSEFSALLQNNRKNINLDTKIILKVQQTRGTYMNNGSLHGEVESDSMGSISLIENLMQEKSSNLFWKSLLSERCPKWRFLSSSSRKNKRECKDKSPEETLSTKEAATEIQMMVNSTPNKLKPMLKRKRKSYADGKSKSSAVLGRSVCEESNSLHDIRDKKAVCNEKQMRFLSKANKSDSIQRRRTRKNSSSLEKNSQFSKADKPIVRDISASKFIAIGLITSPTHILSAQVSKRLPHQHEQVSAYQSLNGSKGQLDQHEQVSTCQPLGDTIMLDNVYSSLLPSIPERLDQCLDTSTSVHTTDPFPGSQNTDTLLVCNTQLPQASHIPLEVPCSTLLEPQQRDLEIMQKVIEQALKTKEDMKLRLKAEFEKEIDQVTEKYVKLLENEEMEQSQKTSDLETYYKKVKECKSLIGVKSSGTQQGAKISDPRCKQSFPMSSSTTTTMSAKVPSSSSPIVYPTTPISLSRVTLRCQQSGLFLESGP